jgi:2,4-dienoyl-CoA reductase-like NADH-dependent reductase (Old Yellow Enzyme family)
MTLQDMIAHYNDLDRVRHSLYKKRSARVKALYRKMQAESGQDAQAFHMAWVSQHSATAQSKVWSSEDERQLQEARHAVKKFGKLLSAQLKASGKKAIRRPGDNCIIALEYRKRVWLLSTGEYLDD